MTAPVAVITGGGTGIGFASAEALVRAGWNVVIAGRREAVLRDAAERLRGIDPTVAVEFLTADARDQEAVDAVFALADDRFGRLDAVVVAAAALHVAPFDELSIEEWDAMIGVVLRGGALAAMAATKRFLATETPGRIVFVGSVSSRVADQGLAHYCAAKAGIDALARSIAVDLGGRGITANVVAPGWINTPMIGEFVDSLPPGTLAAMNPQARAADPKEVGEVVRFLVCDAPSFLTGTTVTVDGGQTAMNHLLPE